MSDATRQRLARLAEQSSTGGRKVSPMQILVLLTTGQSSKDRNTMDFQDHDRHPRTGAAVLRKVTITASGKYLLPTIHDEEVLMALIYLTLADKNATTVSTTQPFALATANCFRAYSAGPTPARTTPASSSPCVVGRPSTSSMKTGGISVAEEYIPGISL